MWRRLGSGKFVTRWLGITVAASIVAVADGGWLASWMSLAPDRIWRGELWRLVTWPLIELGPVSLVFTCLAIYTFGGDLAVRWGDHRLRRFVGRIVIAGAVATCVLAALTGAGDLRRLGGWACADALVIAWARQFPDRPLRIYYGLLELRGRQLITFTLGSAVVFALYNGPV